MRTLSNSSRQVSCMSLFFDIGLRGGFDLDSDNGEASIRGISVFLEPSRLSMYSPAERRMLVGVILGNRLDGVDSEDPKLELTELLVP